jgi:uncharacterized membrane-anchored protein
MFIKEGKVRILRIIATVITAVAGGIAGYYYYLYQGCQSG